MRKSIRFLGVIAALTFLSSVAFGQDATVPTFTPKGSLQYRVGGKNVDKGGKKTDQAGFATDGGFKVGGNVSAGNLTGAFQIGIIQQQPTLGEANYDKPLQVEEGWVSYNFGPASARVNMKEADTGYNADLASRVPLSMSMKVDTEVGAYLILQSPNALITTKEADKDTKNTVVPVFDLGYENKTLLGDKLIVKGGVVIDAANEADSFSDKSEVGFMPYVSGSYKVTERIVFSLDADFGIGMSRITPVPVQYLGREDVKKALADKAAAEAAGEPASEIAMPDPDEAPQFWGIKFGAEIGITDQFTIDGQVRYYDLTTKKLYKDGNSKLYFNASAKYALDSNLYFKGGMFDYNAVTVGDADADTDAFYGVEVGYNF